MTQIETMVETGLKVSCNREELVERLSLVSRAVSTRSAVQVLSGLQLRAEGGELSLAATDMELSMRSSLPAEVGGEGVTVVPGRLLVEIARLLPEARVEIEYRTGENMLAISAGSAAYQVHTYSAEDFPRLPDAAAASTFAVARETLLDTIARVSRSASRDESRPVLTGVLVRFEGGKLTMAATDSYRLAVKESAVAGDIPELEAIVPARALAELGRIAGDADEVRLGVEENHVIFGAEGAWLTTRRIDGQFPDYKQLVPDEFEHTVTLNREEVLDVVRRAAVMAQRNLPLRLSFSEGELAVSARTQDVGEARESMPAPYTGEPLEIGFNADFLRDGLESVESEEIELKLISPLRPGLVSAPGENFWYLIMPIRLAG